MKHVALPFKNVNCKSIHSNKTAATKERCPTSSEVHIIDVTIEISASGPVERTGVWWGWKKFTFLSHRASSYELEAVE